MTITRERKGDNLKSIVLVFCERVPIGVISPISFFSDAHIQKAVGMLENNLCDFVYIVANHFPEGDKDRAEEYITNFTEQLPIKFQSNIFVSTSSRPFQETFLDHVKYFPGIREADIKIFARKDKIESIRGEIDVVFEKHFN